MIVCFCVTRKERELLVGRISKAAYMDFGMKVEKSGPNI
jgi:hypothetical protein